MEQTLITFLLDRTGSMEACKAATIEGFNGYLNSLRREDDGSIRFTFLQFDSQSLDKICVAVPLADAPELTEESYQPRASTPLVDAAFKTIKAVEEAVATSGSKPKVVICIQTDGQENCSCEHTMEELRGLIERRTQEGWQFNFMGAGVDAYSQARMYAQASAMGISGQSTMSYDHTDAKTTREAFAASAANARSYARGQSMNTNYSSGQRAAAGDRVGVDQPDLTPPPTPAPAVAQHRPQTPPRPRPATPVKVVPDFKL